MRAVPLKRPGGLMKSTIFVCCLSLMVSGHAYVGQNEAPCVRLATAGALLFAPILRSGISPEQLDGIIQRASADAHENPVFQALVKQLSKNPGQSNGDAYRLVFTTCMQASGVQDPKTSPLYQWIDEPADREISLGNGIRFQFGQSLEDFVAAHPGGQCFDFQHDKLCEYQEPDESLCMGRRICSDTTFIFRDEKLVGFHATYSSDDWKRLFDLTETIYGKPLVKEVSASSEMSMGNRASIWRLKRGELDLVKFSGMDASGQPIANPYSVVFGPEDKSD